MSITRTRARPMCANHPDKPGRTYTRPSLCGTCYRRANRDVLIASERRRHRHYRYGLTDADYAVLWDAQQGLCAVCLSAPPTDIDHCHRTNAVRGLLCRRCNLALGGMQDSPAVLRRAIRYLEGGQ